MIIELSILMNVQVFYFFWRMLSVPSSPQKSYQQLCDNDDNLHNQNIELTINLVKFPLNQLHSISYCIYFVQFAIDL